jgi:phage recombination protein Bet
MVVAESWTGEQTAVLRGTYAKGLSDGEFGLFAQVCQRTGLDPFRRQVYAIKRGGQVTFQTSIDGYRAIAHRTGEYDGQDDVEWCGEDGIWRSVWTGKSPPFAARVRVHRRGKAYSAVARFDAYAQGTDFWRKMAAEQLAKCAESCALRKAFPEHLAGLYTKDEMAQADKPGANGHDPDTGEVYAEPAQPRLDKLLHYSALLAGCSTAEAVRKIYRAARDDKDIPRGENRDAMLTQIEKRGLSIVEREKSAPRIPDYEGSLDPDEGP